MPPEVALINGEDQVFIELTCDTLVIDADANVFHLVWRKSMDKNSTNQSSTNENSNNQKSTNKKNTHKNRIKPYSQIVVQQSKQDKKHSKSLKAQGEASRTTSLKRLV
jgi:hypothetical protein